MKALKVVGFIFDKAIWFTLAGLIIICHFAMNAVGFIIGAVCGG